MFYKKSLFLLPIIFFTFIFVILLFRSENSFELLSNESENIELAIYINDEETNIIPGKDSGYYYDREKSSCTNGAYINWDSISWSPVVKNMNEYKTKCELYFKTGYKESILNGTDPVLKDPLIPVTIESDGTVKKASLANEWYSYEKKNWANAVILFDENETYEDGEIIPEEKIESYFVWIPKYRYQLWDLGNYESLTSIDTSKVHEIPIIFGDYNTSDNIDGECTTPMTSGATGNCAVGDYMTHPAFLSIPSTGFWVGKFETGYRGATNTVEAEQNTRDASKIVVKSNTYSWRGIQVANAFYTSYDYQRDLDSHMMKNTEWGAVAYLQYSAYGNKMNVRINNNSSLITGYQANSEPTCGYTSASQECNRYCNDGSCNTSYPNSILASTTGNISGIYDMSGGAWEYVMGVMMDQSGNPMSGRNSIENSRFNGRFGTEEGSFSTGYDWPDSKYYDQYVYTTSSVNYQNRILGDATGEMGPFAMMSSNNSSGSFYNSSSWLKASLSFVTVGYPYYGRGGTYHDGFQVRILSTNPYSGTSVSSWSFRIVLTP